MNNLNRLKFDKFRELLFNEISPLINNDFILLDTPNHRNIGDSLIWAGELEFFKDLNYKCIDQYNRDTFLDSAIKADDVIILHGGGNFGDIYKSSQRFKKHIVENFPNNRIIIMPQTIHYLDNQNLVDDFNIFNKHGDLHLFVRDIPSYDILKKNFNSNNFSLVPDMAFYLNFDDRIIKNSLKKSLYFNRTDSEANNKLFNFEGDNMDIADWPTYSSNSQIIHRIQNYFESLDGKVTNQIKHYPFLNKFIINNAYGFKSSKNMEKYIDIGIKFINNYDTIYTTRLHGLILSILLDKNVIILDNKYNKCKNYYDAWLKDISNIKFFKLDE